MTTTIYSARKIITMNPNRPEVTHVAVRDGRILGAGDLDELTSWGANTVDSRFADKVLMPGMIEGHGHSMEGAMWNFTYVGWFDRMDPDGKVWSGVKSVDDVIDRLRARGLVQLSEHESDRRRVVVDLSAEGASLVEALLKDAERITAETAKPLTQRETATLLRLLARIA